MENNENKEDILDTDDVISLIANKKKFTKSDVKEILEGLIWVLEESVKKGKTVKIRSLGKLYSQQINIKNIRSGEPTTATRNIFRLAKNIRFNNQEKNLGVDFSEDV